MRSPETASSGVSDEVFTQACCMTLVRGLDVAETFARLGADISGGPSVCFDELVRSSYAEHGRRLGRQLAGAATLDGWTLVLEPNGYACSDPAVLRAVSAGTTTVTLYHCDGDSEISVMADGRRSHRLDLPARHRVELEPRRHVAFWSTPGPALVERFSGVRLSSGLVHDLRYRTGLLDLW